MKSPINAYLYPTPKELDYQLALRRAFAFDQRNHMSSDDTDGPVEMSEAERTVRDVFAEMLGIPAEFITGTTTGRFIPNAPDEFVWRSHSGKRYNVTDMATNHIFYALRMLFNHTVPPAFRVLGPGEVMNRYPDVPHWSPAYRQAAISAFTNELNERADLDGSLKYQFEDMQANTKTILVLGL